MSAAIQLLIALGFAAYIVRLQRENRWLRARRVVVARKLWGLRDQRNLLRDVGIGVMEENEALLAETQDRKKTVEKVEWVN
jgi:hypothetical protein